MSELALTGERTLPGIDRENYWFQRHVAAYRFAATVIPDGARVLEVGCGEGYGSAMLGERRRVLALEHDAAAARHAARRYSLPVLRGDACRLPVADESVDAVVALQVIEHLLCADRFVAACSAALRRDGVLLVSTPNRPTFSPDGTLNPFHVYEYDAEELEALLRVHFRTVRLFGLRHGVALRAAERAVLPAPLPRLLSDRSWEALPARARALARRVRPRHFRVRRRAEAALDLVAVCR